MKMEYRQEIFGWLNEECDNKKISGCEKIFDGDIIPVLNSEQQNLIEKNNPLCWGL